METEIQGEPQVFSADIVAVACCAINSAVLLLQSANHRHSNGLANGSDQVGRNFMKHQKGAILGVRKRVNPTIFQKTLAVNDFCWGDQAFEYPMGHVQLLARANKDMLTADAPSFRQACPRPNCPPLYRMAGSSGGFTRSGKSCLDQRQQNPPGL